MIGSSTGRDDHHVHITLRGLQGDLADRIDCAGEDAAQCCRLLLNLIQHMRSPHGARLLLHEYAPFLNIITDGDPSTPTMGDPRVPAPHPLLSRPYRTVPPTPSCPRYPRRREYPYKQGYHVSSY